MSTFREKTTILSFCHDQQTLTYQESFDSP